MSIKLSEVVTVLIHYAGTADNPRIGWRGQNSSNPNLYECERCGEVHEDFSKIIHKEYCSAKAVLDMLDRIKSEIK